MTAIHSNGGGQSFPKIGMSYMEPEPIKLVEVPVYYPGPRPVLKPRKSQTGIKAQHSRSGGTQLTSGSARIQKAVGAEDFKIERWIFSQ